MALDVGGALRVLRLTQVRHPGRELSPTSTIPTSASVKQQMPRVALVDGIERVSSSVVSARRAAIDVLFCKYYPVGHKSLHLVPGALDLQTLGRVGRVDEVSPLKKVVLAMPHALAGDYPHSPGAEKLPRINQHRAFSDHATMTRLLLDNDVEVYLTVPPAAATEAVYATDVVTAIANQVAVSSPLEGARRLELQMYKGGMRLDEDGLEGAPVEWGDHLQAFRDGVLHVFQGFDSMRGNAASVERLKHFLRRIEEASGQRIEHHAIQLAGKDTLHLDYAVNYGGIGKSRAMVVCPDAIANDNDIELMRHLFEVPAGNTCEVTRTEMLRGAANISNISPQCTIIAKNPSTERTIEFLRSRGIDVADLRLEMAKKDGTSHCCIGQVLRL